MDGRFRLDRTGSFNAHSLTVPTRSSREEKILEPHNTHLESGTPDLERPLWPELPDDEKAARNRRSWRRATLLFFLTILSTFAVGSGMVAPSPASTLDFLRGWVFAVPLMGILLFHEFGHFLLARRHGVEVSPPYFIPFPNLIGTMGAFISIRSPIHNRQVLFDIGAAGPLAGFIPSVIALALGYHFSTTAPMVTDAIVFEFGDSLLTLALQYLVIGPVPEGLAVWIHPVGLAGWVGLFVTMLNLLPIGQLDGGHVAYALAGHRQWLIGPIAVLVLVILGMTVSRWWWLLLGFLVFVYLVVVVSVRLLYGVKIPISGLWKGDILRHPPVPDEGPLDPRRRLLGWICIIILVLCFIPLPINVLNLPVS